ncbi:MAG: hypothetical protein ABIG43_03240 [Chloroflexota bacterium]
MSKQKSVKPRPYWHVDAKWIIGILLVFILSITFIVFNLGQITNAENGIDLQTLMIASIFNQQSGGLDDNVTMETILQNIAEEPKGAWQPVPGLNITVREEEIEGLALREIRLLFFRKWAEPLYNDGIDGLANLADDPELRANIIEGGALLEIISAENHSKLQLVLVGLVITDLVLLALLILFSYRFGRLSSPGFVIFLAALPGILLLPLSAGLGETSSATSSEGIGVYTAMLTNIAAEALPDVISIVSRNYLIFLGIGSGLIFLALLGTIFIRKKTIEPKPADPPSQDAEKASVS